MTRFIFLNILLLLLLSCGGNSEGYIHDLPYDNYPVTGDVEKGMHDILPPVQCAVELMGDDNASVGVSYFYIEKHDDTLFWEEGHLKVPIRQDSVE